jgi:hypothetical protein
LEQREYFVCLKRVTNVYQGEEVTAASKYRVNPQPHDHLSKHAKEVEQSQISDKHEMKIKCLAVSCYKSTNIQTKTSSDHAPLQSHGISEVLC